MADLNGYIKINRGILNWRWFKNPKTLTVWLWILASANFKPNDFEGETIHKGEVATSYASIASQANLSINEVRTAILHLKSTGEITTRLRSHYQVITVVNWEKYQTGTGRDSGISQPFHNHFTTTSQQRKNDKNDKNEKNIYCPPSADEVRAYAAAQGLELDVDDFLDYNESRGWAGVTDWRPLVRIRARQTQDAKPKDNDGLDVWGKPIRKEFE